MGNMKKNIIILLLLFSVSILSAQEDITGKLINSIDKSKIDLATIGIKNTRNGTYSSMDGSFLLKNVSSKDTLLFYHLSFEDKKIAMSDFPEDGKIYLCPKENQLSEVIISGKASKVYELIPKKRLLMNSCMTVHPGLQLSRLVQDTTLAGSHIKDFTFLTKKVKIDNYYFRIHLYKNIDNKPGDEILIKENLYRLKKGSRKSIIDIRSKNLLFPKEGVFCSLEWIGELTDNCLHEIDGESIDLHPKVLINNSSKDEFIYMKVWNIDWLRYKDVIGETPDDTFLIGLNIVK
jgi:hypothetical protein